MKKFLILLLAVVVYTNAFAKPVDPQMAENVAIKFVRQRTLSLELKSVTDFNLAYVYKSESKNASGAVEIQNYFYVFTAPEKGFVLVAADDRVSPILGYSAESNFIPGDVPPQVAKWFEAYKEQVRYAIVNNLPATEEIASDWAALKGENSSFSQPGKRGSVSPLLTTKWNQSPYYNANCPYDNTYGQRTVTGCVATAMAQVMKYHNYPAKGNGSYSYNHDVYGTLSANFSSTTYNWSSMPNSVSNANSAVATLMYQVGVSVNMNYGLASSGGSGAYVVSSASAYTNCAEYALKTYFDYKTTLSGIERKNFTSSVWLSKMKAELDASRPIIYAGFGTGGGHCFVADGYDNNDFLHFNWGWGGAYDGYFSINALNPGGVGTGGGTGGFNNNHQAVIGIQPNSTGTGGSSAYDLRLYANITISPNPVDYGEGFTVTTNIANFGTSSAQNYSGDYAAAVFNSDNQFVAFVETKTGFTLNFNNYYVNPLTFTSAGINAMTPGTYTVGIYYKPTGGSQWYAVGNGSYQNFVTLEVNDNSTNDLKLYTAVITTPGILVQNQSFTVTFDIANYGTTDFNGDVSVDLHKSDGTWIRELSIKTGLNLPTMTHFTNGLTYTITGGLPDEPGTYMFFIWNKPDGGSWEFLGSGNYSNPITVQLKAPGITPDVYEVNNTLAQSFNMPVSFQGNLAKYSTGGSNCHNGNDYDFYKIVLPANYNYVVNARLHDSYSSGNGNVYSLDAIVSYSTDGTTWSDVFDDIVSTINVKGGGTVYFMVSPYFTGNTGTYLFDVNITRTPNTSIGESSVNERLVVYPNPVKDLIYFNADNLSVDKVNVMGITGTTVEMSVKNNSIDMSDFSNGVYVIQFITSEGIINKKVVIQK